MNRTCRLSYFAAASLATLLAVPAFAQNATTPAFEVSTIKLSAPDSEGAHTGMRGGTFTASNVTLKTVLSHQAFATPEPRIVGGPKWLDTAHFDVEAKMTPASIAQLQALPPEQGMQQFQSMFQQLLADRFQLKTHWETRELPVYALVIANPKNAPILQPAKDPTHSGTSSGPGQLQAVSATLTDIAEEMTRDAASELGRVVIDKTGITGKYDIRLKWTPDTGTVSPTPNSDAAPPPSIFTAIQEQLGLKLEPSKGPVRVLVIDSVEMPTAN